MSKIINKKKYTVHLLFTGNGFGGSGKRFMDISLYIASPNRLFKIYTSDSVRKRLYQQFGDIKNKYIDFIIIGESYKSQKEFLSNSKNAKKLLKKNYKKGDIVHIHGINPFIPFWKYNYLYSYVCMYLPFTNLVNKYIKKKFKSDQFLSIKNKKIKKVNSSILKNLNNFKTYFLVNIKQILLILMADHIDILNPQVYLLIKKYFSKKKISCTKGIAPAFFKRNIIKKKYKENRIIFLGRYDKQKGIEKLFSIIPKLSKFCFLNEKYCQIDLIGEGSIEEDIFDAKKYCNNYFKIRNYWSDSIVEDLNSAKIFLSIQDYSNYPSRSLVEAMSLGLIPIVSNSGESKLMLPLNYKYLIAENNLELNLYLAIISIIQLSDEEIERLSAYILNFAKKRFSLSRHTQYYSNLYDKLARFSEK
tara:strand:+ start:2196 stop:3446 length:1251 start_codon:yes stop_codon:yes gene_type:complete